MKRSLILFVGLVIILSLVLSISGCSSGTTTTSGPPTYTTNWKTTTSTTPAQTTTTSAPPASTTTTSAPPASTTTTSAPPASTTTTAAAAALPWQEAKNHIGETITVEGPIIDKFDIGTAMLLGMGKSAMDNATVGIEISYALAKELPADLFVGKTIRVTGTTYQNPLGGCSLIVANASDIEVIG